MKSSIRYARTFNVQHKTIFVVPKWISISNNGRVNASLLLSRVVCRETTRILDNGTGRKSYDPNKTKPLVTRNAIEIVSSTLPYIVHSYESCAAIDIALILVQSPV